MEEPDSTVQQKTKKSLRPKKGNGSVIEMSTGESAGIRLGKSKDHSENGLRKTNKEKPLGGKRREGEKAAAKKTEGDKRERIRENLKSRGGQLIASLVGQSKEKG